MTATDTQELRCRTCGRPRGENIAEGTRCARCGTRQALIIWVTCAVAAGFHGVAADLDVGAAIIRFAVALVAVPASLFATVLIHEMLHAGLALLQGQTVTRIVIGEGSALWRVGLDPELLIGSVVLGNGVTHVLDLRQRGYRVRMIAMLLVAPAGSALLGASAWILASDVGPGWQLTLRFFSLANLFMAAITLIPVPTFGKRVWSDLAMAIHVARGTDADTREQIVACARERVEMLLQTGHTARAIETARAALAAVPESGLAVCVLAYALWHGDQKDEAVTIARQTLAGNLDEESRAYLTRVIEASQT